MRFSPDLRLLSVDDSSFNDGFSLYDTQTGAFISGPGNASYSSSISGFSPDYNRFTVTETDIGGCPGFYVALRLWEVGTEGSLMVTGLSGWGDGYNSYGFNTNGDLLFVATDYGIEFWDAHTGEQLATTIENNGQGNAGITTDGTLLVTTGDEGTIRLWGIPAD